MAPRQLVCGKRLFKPEPKRRKLRLALSRQRERDRRERRCGEACRTGEQAAAGEAQGRILCPREWVRHVEGPNGNELF
jgi:hypothetical protein